jgi:hypothetical protein
MDSQIGEGPTQEVAQFIVFLKYSHIMSEVVELGKKKSMLDGQGGVPSSQLRV